MVAEGIVAAIEGEGFEHYLPDMKAVVEFKNADIDTYPRRRCGHGRPRQTVKALVFGVRPETVERARRRQRL